MLESLSRAELFGLHRTLFLLLEKKPPDMTLMELATIANQTLCRRLQIEKMTKHTADTAESETQHD